MMACVECGKHTDWVMRLDVPRKSDPPSPMPMCPGCATYGRYKRRNKTMWRLKGQA